MRFLSLCLALAVLGATIPGCGDDINAPIPKSPYAPTSDQMKAFGQQIMKNAMPVKGRRKSR